MEMPKKPPHRAITFQDALSAIAGTLETWLPRLVESNDALEEALLLLRGLYLSRNSLMEDAVLKRVEETLEKAAIAKRRLLANSPIAAASCTVQCFAASTRRPCRSLSRAPTSA
jgi:hypothetical protein